jgi:selenocysteine lyase/cysteine desulfurase
LEESVAPARRLDVDALLAESRRFRAGLKFTATAEEIDRFKRAGRR